MEALRAQRTYLIPAACKLPAQASRGQANGSDSSDSSRPGSGDTIKAAGRVMLGAPTGNATRLEKQLEDERASRNTTEPNLLHTLLPPDVQEMLLHMPMNMQADLLSAAMAALSTQGNGATVPSSPLAAHRMQNATQGVANEWHGLLGNGSSWLPPKVAARSCETARPGYDTGDASEYLDSPEVLSAKVQMLAQMWKRSGRDTVLYTGAGLSTASGIGDYASKASKSVAPHKKRAESGSRLELRPTLAHHTLAAIEEKGLIGNWVQQNHDRLAQKAGFPQARINEIHGAWGDMKNSVAMMDDSLRADLLAWLRSWAERANMCVALGTSLCGMNADQVPRAVADRFAQSSGEGLVIIGLQRTVYDDVASLRIWGLCDDVMKLVAKELGCKVPDPKVAQRGNQWAARHPRCAYNTPKRSVRDPL